MKKFKNINKQILQNISGGRNQKDYNFGKLAGTAIVCTLLKPEMSLQNCLAKYA